MMNRLIKQFIQWPIAVAVGFLLVNMICCAYELPARVITIPNGFSEYVRQPNTILIHGTEGYSIAKTDKNGYLNPDKELADEYILMLGASHTSAREVPFNKKYSVLVNDYFDDDNFLHTYNIAHEGNFLPGQIRHFKAAMDAFPNAKAVTIEIYNTDYSVEELTGSINQAVYDPNDSVLRFYNASFTGKIKTWIRYFLPLWEQIKNQKETYLKARNGSKEFEVDFDEYRNVINEALSIMRSEYDGPLVFAYHPEITINQDGSISLVYSKTWEVFNEACSMNGIDVIDTGEAFLRNYEANHELPYGFFNTTMGRGHMNKVGHRIMANEIIDYLEALK